MTLSTLINSLTKSRNALLALAILGLCGCSVAGPQMISKGRGAYAEVINRTANEQILNVIVRKRYDETFGMMTVAAVTANLRFSTQVSANFGIGDSDSYEGNLVPLSAGVGYEESPTISYVPLSGEDFTRRMLTPVTIEEWLLLGAQAKRPGYMLDLGVRSINGLNNSLASGRGRTKEFSRLITVFDELRRAGVLDTVQIDGSDEESGLFWHFGDYTNDNQPKIREFLDLLGIETIAPIDGSEFRVLIRQGLGSSTSVIRIQTRSAFDVLSAFGNGIDIPPSHLEARIVEPLDSALAEERQFVKIRTSEKRPENATVRILFRGYWFYIDETDAASKRAFIFLRTLIGIRLADLGGEQRSPLITVPVR